MVLGTLDAALSILGRLKRLRGYLWRGLRARPGTCVVVTGLLLVGTVVAEKGFGLARGWNPTLVSVAFAAVGALFGCALGWWRVQLEQGREVTREIAWFPGTSARVTFCPGKRSIRRVGDLMCAKHRRTLQEVGSVRSLIVPCRLVCDACGSELLAGSQLHAQISLEDVLTHAIEDGEEPWRDDWQVPRDRMPRG